ncbi:MAG TPA: class I SAM-dependent methyltransferase [Gemmatimonadaceae bacterium]|nr:class I SAM-dependent methyltransferase [Gemmatimonadaceae bacterium]
MTNDSDRDWERFGKTDPYFAVLTAPQYHGELSDSDRAEFFRSGETHVDQVLSIIRGRLDAGFAPARALDFGCGVGRLLIPLAARCREVTGVDVSPAMLAEARRNCDNAGASQVRLLPSDDELSAVKGEFDFVHSYIVLQHVPVRRGEQLVQELAKRLAPNGVGVFHVTYAQASNRPLSRVLYWARMRVPGAHWALNDARGRPAGAPLMQINRYSVTRLLDILRRNGCSEVYVRFSDHQGYLGVLLFARKTPDAGTF